MSRAKKAATRARAEREAEIEAMIVIAGASKASAWDSRYLGGGGGVWRNVVLVVVLVVLGWSQVLK